MMIAEVSKRYGLTSDTLRYYERIGLIPPVTRNPSGIRIYREEIDRTIKRLDGKIEHYDGTMVPKEFELGLNLEKQDWRVKACVIVNLETRA